MGQSEDDVKTCKGDMTRELEKSKEESDPPGNKVKSVFHPQGRYHLCQMLLKFKDRFGFSNVEDFGGFITSDF